jgi:hypothetical protein
LPFLPLLGSGPRDRRAPAASFGPGRDAPDRERHVRVRPRAGQEAGAAAVVGVGRHAAVHGRGRGALGRARPDVRHRRVAVAGAVAGLLAPQLRPAAPALAVAGVGTAVAALAPGAPGRAVPVPRALSVAGGRVVEEGERQEARRRERGGRGRGGARDGEARRPVRVLRAGGRGGRGRRRRRGLLPRVVAPVGGPRRGGRRGGRRRGVVRVERVPDGGRGGEVLPPVPRYRVRRPRRGHAAHRRARQDHRGELCFSQSPLKPISYCLPSLLQCYQIHYLTYDSAVANNCIGILPVYACMTSKKLMSFMHGQWSPSYQTTFA